VKQSVLVDKKKRHTSCVFRTNNEREQRAPAVRRHVATEINLNIFHVMYCKNVYYDVHARLTWTSGSLCTVFRSVAPLCFAGIHRDAVLSK